ncbi:putative glutamine amidotransferase [Cavenderia fasciculata]|uniref:Glutamine amidotransferase n=1 Tax=Cavenderia fasciculata TaxID=261658 RepID=F4PX33_CACFS|nr:putative glutamine amidotransferase [Cavenderia fasciculata]EGG19836.1 putative glutamine amidotransferase [Cavenderia fasciculata]|eukprot:XP_004358182.1 putative glutamine amidotransferase [Cavenderia fasciculata]
MCRFIFYLGSPIKLSAIVTEPSHGLLHQSLHSICPGVSLNADGFGIAWWVPEITPIPCVFKDITPAWSNVNLRQLSRVVKSGCLMSHIRAASAGAITTTNCHPFTYRNLSWMHNGTLSYHTQLRRDVLNLLSQSGFELIKGTTDTELLFALFITNYEREIGYVPKPKEISTTAIYSTHHSFLEPEEEAYPKRHDNAQIFAKVLKETIHQVHALILKYEIDNGIVMDEGDAGASATLQITKTCAKLNLCVSDGSCVVASRYVTGPTTCAHTLFWSRGQSLECDKGACLLSGSTNTLKQSVIISSEPLALDFKCSEVPVNNMVVANDDGYFEILPIN